MPQGALIPSAHPKPQPVTTSWNQVCIVLHCGSNLLVLGLGSAPLGIAHTLLCSHTVGEAGCDGVRASAVCKPGFTITVFSGS